MTAEARRKISEEPCRCIVCDACGGTGSVWRAFDGTYLGNHRSDDMDELERCEECDHGIVEICARCEALCEFDNE